MMEQTRFKLKLILIVVIIYAFIPVYSMAVDKEWTLSVQGIQIIGNGYKGSSENFMPFNQFKGTAVSCLLTARSGGIINFVDVKSTIKEFKDNTGKNLFDPEAMHGNGFGLMRQISKDKTALMLDITGSNLPDKEATSMSASGKITVNVATKSDKLSIKNIDFSTGAIIETPFAKLKIVNLKKSSWGEHPYKVVFESGTNLSVIKNIRFTHLNGQPIESNRAGGGSHNIVGDLSTLKFEKEYSIADKPAKVNMTIDYWVDMETKNIPFSLTTSIGL